MGFSCGVVGLPNAGKSTLFNALTSAGAAVASYPFCTIDPKEGKVPVPDERLKRLQELVSPPKTTPTHLSFVDIAGLVKGAHEGEGLGNRFLSHIREVDLVVHTVRLFEDGKVSHVHQKVDPISDLDVIMTELMLADLETVKRRREKVEKLARVGDKESKKQLDFLQRVESNLAQGIPASMVSPRDRREALTFRDLFLLTAKPAILVANIGEDQIGREDELLEPIRTHLRGQNIPCIAVCANLESELVDLSPEDRAVFMEDLSLAALALEQVVRVGYDRLGLLTFYTTAGAELRAWTVPSGTSAPAAAGRIHTDMEDGFIKAEVVSFPDFDKSGSEGKARSKGLIRIEGKDYEIRDGDVVFFHFRGK